MLGTSGIRGKYGEKITASKIYEWSNKFAQDLPYIYIGRDIRNSSFLLSQAAAVGTMAAGKTVYDLGIVSTGIMGFATNSIMITASHNPEADNGIKFIKDKRELMKQESHVLTNPLKEDGIGTYVKTSIFEDYLKALSIFDFSFEGKTFEVNSAVQTFFTWYAQNTKERFSLINNVPKLVRKSNPIKENLPNFKEGFAYDADGDRVSLFQNYEQYSPDLLFGVVARYMAEQRQKRTLVVTVEAPKYLVNYLSQYYSHIRIVPVGSPYVGYELMKYKQSFGGEPNGEYIFPEISYVPDAIASTTALIEIEKEGYLELPNIKPYPVERRNYPVENKQQKMEQIKTQITEDYSNIDGILINQESYKVLIRPSGTENLIRLTIEAETKELLNSLIEKYEKIIKN